MAQITRPGTVILWYRGNPYRIDLERCRHAFGKLVVAGELRGMRDLARKLGIRRTTASGFFLGKKTSLTVTLKILEALKATIADVGRPLDDDPTDPPAGGAAGRVTLRPKPCGDGDPAAVTAAEEHGHPRP
jgi:hypothetical protein